MFSCIYTTKHLQRMKILSNIFERINRNYYSNSNCETFVNFCFTSKPISYQSELNKCKAVVGDATIDASSNLTNNLLKSTGTKLLNSVIQEGL